jgi:quinol-cytochrome oxidoreductase complex cytochrome b subunit
MLIAVTSLLPVLVTHVRMVAVHLQHQIAPVLQVLHDALKLGYVFQMILFVFCPRPALKLNVLEIRPPIVELTPQAVLPKWHVLQVSSCVRTVCHALLKAVFATQMLCTLRFVMAVDCVVQMVTVSTSLRTVLPLHHAVVVFSVCRMARAPQARKSVLINMTVKLFLVRLMQLTIAVLTEVVAKTKISVQVA